MIYVDTSVVLAHVFAEDRRPRDSFWEADLTSSRLLMYEVFTRAHARRITSKHLSFVREFVDRISFLELSHTVLERALEPLPVPVRTLDALHLASMDYLRRLGTAVELASYDDRLLKAALTLGFAITPL